VNQEKDSAIDNFDSGLPIEDIVREALAGMLPTRYSVRSGTVVDGCGSTAGDVDVAGRGRIRCGRSQADADIPIARRRIGKACSLPQPRSDLCASRPID